MQVFLQIVAFSLQIIGSDRPVLTKGKRPKIMTFVEVVEMSVVIHQQTSFLYFIKICHP